MFWCSVVFEDSWLYLRAFLANTLRLVATFLLIVATGQKISSFGVSLSLSFLPHSEERTRLQSAWVLHTLLDFPKEASWPLMGEPGGLLSTCPVCVLPAQVPIHFSFIATRCHTQLLRPYQVMALKETAQISENSFTTLFGIWWCWELLFTEAKRCPSTPTPRTSHSPRRPGVLRSFSFRHLNCFSITYQGTYDTFDCRFWSNYVAALKGKILFLLRNSLCTIHHRPPSSRPFWNSQHSLPQLANGSSLSKTPCLW